MSKKTSYLLGMLLTIVIGTALYCYLCDDCHCSSILNSESTTSTESTDRDNVVDTPTSDAKTSNSNAFNTGFMVKDDSGSLNISSNDNFNFGASNFSISMPVSESVDEEISKLKAYLMANPGKSLPITGYYTSGETNNSAFPNLGLARANSVKNYLVLKGIPSKRMDTNGELKNDLVANSENIYTGPVSFKIGSGNSDMSDADIKALGDKIRANPLVLYFNSGQASINLTTEQRQKIADISKYLDKVDGSKSLVTSHTDSKGRRVTNMRVSQGRADFAKNYLVQNGIPADKIVTSSKGPDEPIATNATAEGRAKNRRTVVTIN